MFITDKKDLNLPINTTLESTGSPHPSETDVKVTDWLKSSHPCLFPQQPSERYEQACKTAIQIVSDSNLYTKWPTSSFGTVPVYFPSDLPLVVKETGHPANEERLGKKQKAIEICARSNYEKLQIARGVAEKSFIFEAKLPIKSTDYKTQMAVYAENRSLFTQAVKEFTGLLLQSKFTDLVGYSKALWPRIVKSKLNKDSVQFGRYDNVAFYKKSNEGFIALVDLEHFEGAPGNSFVGHPFELDCASTATFLFPYHFEDIYKTIQNAYPKIDRYRGELEFIRDESLENFKVIHENHSRILKNQRVTLADPFSFPGIDISAETLCAAVKEKYKRGQTYGHLAKKLDPVWPLFDEALANTIIPAFERFIKNGLDGIKEKSKQEPDLLDWSTVVAMRTLHYHIADSDYVTLRNTIADALNFSGLDAPGERAASLFEKEYSMIDTLIVRTLIDSIFDALEKLEQVGLYIEEPYSYDKYIIYC